MTTTGISEWGGIFQADYMQNIVMACQIKAILVCKHVILVNAG